MKDSVEKISQAEALVELDRSIGRVPSEKVAEEKCYWWDQGEVRGVRKVDPVVEELRCQLREKEEIIKQLTTSLLLINDFVRRITEEKDASKT